MTPVPKNLNRKQRLQWRRMVALGFQSQTAGVLVAAGRETPHGRKSLVLPFVLPRTL